MIYNHYSESPWDKQRWPNFSPSEFACSHCGEFYYAPDIFDRAQFIRNRVGPVKINSAHRCITHNRVVGGALLSTHKLIALDLSVRNIKPESMLQAALDAGFTTFGFYRTFLHVDTRPGRRWITEGGKITWNGLVK